MENDLTREEFDWLVRLGSVTALMITVQIANRLKELGYAKQGLGGPIITDAGRARVRKGFGGTGR